MEYFRVILWFAIPSFMGWYASIFPTKKLIQRVTLNNKYWPQRYVMPPRGVRKLFKLKKKEIPKWLYREFFLSFFYIVLFFGGVGFFLISEEKWIAMRLFGVIYGVVAICNMLYISIFMWLYK